MFTLYTAEHYSDMNLFVKGTELIEYQRSADEQVRYLFESIKYGTKKLYTLAEPSANALGILIYKKLLDKDFVSVIVLKNNQEDKSYRYNDEGYMQEDWPIGFYSPKVGWYQE